MLALLGALREEIVDVQRQMTIAEVMVRPDFKLYQGRYQNRDCLLVQTGLGKQRVETAARFILEQFPVSAIISFGFAGALAAELRVGDIIVCSVLYCCNGMMRQGLEPEALSSDANLLEPAARVLESVRARFCCGSSVAVPRLLANPELKEKWYKISKAHVADMESYWVARIASKKRIPFLAIRVVSDSSRDSLPPFAQMLVGNGSRPWGKAVTYFILHPQDLPKLPGLYSRSRSARKNLTECIAQIVANMNSSRE